MGAAATEKDYRQLHVLEGHGVKLVAFSNADKTKLFIDAERIDAESPLTCSAASLESLLRKEFSRAELHREVLEDVAEHLMQGKKVEKRRVARGEEPTPGRDGKIVLLVKALKQKQGANELEWVDARFAKSFDNVEAGTVVGRLYKPTAGHPGKDIFGEEIAAKPGAESAVKTDDSIQVEAAQGHPFENLKALQAGYLAEVDGKLTVQPILQIRGDIDFHTGDIDFVGTLEIKGSIRKGFSVRARTNISIQGDVQHGAVYCEQGNVQIKGSVFGDCEETVTINSNPSAGAIRSMRAVCQVQVRAKGGIKARMVNAAALESESHIEIEKEVRSARLFTRGYLMASKAHLLGGTVYTVCGAEVGQIGSDGEVPTKIQLVNDVESTAEYVELREQISDIEHRAEATSLYLGPYAEKPVRLKLLNADYRKKMEKLLQKLSHLLKKRDELEAKRVALLQNAKITSSYHVNILEKAWPGTALFAEGNEYRVADQLKGPVTISYQPEKQAFAVGELQPLECHLPPINSDDGGKAKKKGAK